MGILFINDPHIADRPPLGRVAGYADQIMAKLEECRELAHERGCELTIFTGDLFHTKRPSFVSHALIQRLIELFREWPGRVLVILGNHDMNESGLASLPRQPIGVLLRAGVLELLEDDVTVKIDGLRVQLSPAHFRTDADLTHYSLARQFAVDVAIKVVHQMIMPPGTTPPFEHTPAATIDTDGMDYCFYGHAHTVHGEYVLNGCHFVNFGSLGRVARTPDNWERSVQVVVWTPPDRLEVVVLQSALPGEQVFLISDELAGRANDDDLKAYARELTHALVTGSSTSIETLLAEATEGVEDGVRELVKQYLEGAGL
jgi:DNA repair exonuclease SbcCD nuclease subunit